ncbi:MAG: YkgJ family cysteine cluster protein [Lachnospiraceae bacterium]|nr:YkgJ family cysteine cluster protein [Lachnospiraceae bacterium]
MLRDVDMNEISDGKLYRNTDMVKIGVRDCEGCSYCCKAASDTILLDPFDIYNLTRVTCLSTNELKNNGYIRTRIVDGMVQPYLSIDEEKGCVFLNEEQRCSIHNYRPGICRLFPLGRIYKDDTFYYFNQIHECISKLSRTKVKISKWLGIENQKAYDEFILKWHGLITDFREVLEDANLREAHEYNLYFYNLFYMLPYKEDFYQEINNRIVKFLIKIDKK